MATKNFDDENVREENGFSVTGYGVFVTGNCGANIITSMTECEAARKALAHTNFFFSSFKNPDDIDSSHASPSWMRVSSRYMDDKNTQTISWILRGT